MENTEDVAGEVAATPAVEKKKCKLWVKITCIVLAAVIGVIAVLGITFACVWSDEISSVRSFTKLRNRKDSNQEGAVYMMRVKGGFYFDDFLAHGKLTGFGSTDFRPVFDYVEKLREKQEFDNLKGLLYFTDGYGIYPERMPDYDVAFVFLHEDENAPKVPPWAIRIVLDEEALEEEKA